MPNFPFEASRAYRAATAEVTAALRSAREVNSCIVPTELFFGRIHFIEGLGPGLPYAVAPEADLARLQIEFHLSFESETPVDFV